MNIFDITFSVTGGVTQTVEIDPCITREDFVVGLAAGVFVTTIGHGENNGCIYRLDGDSLAPVGRVVAQESHDDTEFLDYACMLNRSSYVI